MLTSINKTIHRKKKKKKLKTNLLILPSFFFFFFFLETMIEEEKNIISVYEFALNVKITGFSSTSSTATQFLLFIN